MAKNKNQWLVFVIILLTAFTFSNSVEAAPQSVAISTTNLSVSLEDVEEFELFYFASCDGGGCGPAVYYDFTAADGYLKDRGTTISLGKLQRLLSSLHTMYPGTRQINYMPWDGYYPKGRATIHLSDDRTIVIFSSSQFARMIPWNVQVFQKTEAGDEQLIGSYVILHDDVHKGLSVLWQTLFRENFPNNETKEEWLDEYSYSYEKEEGLYLRYTDGYSYDAAVFGMPTHVLDPFVPLLSANDDLALLFNQGYQLFDAALTMRISIENFQPIGYEGMIALKAPDSPDVIVGTVSISIGEETFVETSLIADDVPLEFQERKQYAFLDTVHEIIPDIVFLTDTRDLKYYSEIYIRIPEFSCPADESYKVGFQVEALLTDHAYNRITFFNFPSKNSWAVDFEISRDEAGWDDELISTILAAWWPSEFNRLKPSQLDWFSTTLGGKFLPNVTEEIPALMPFLKYNLPPETFFHFEDPEKEGDQSLFNLDGRVIVPEDGLDPYIIFCDSERSGGTREKYPIDDVKVPDQGDTRTNNYSTVSGYWIYPRPFPTRKSYPTKEITGSAIGSSSPGYIHLLWSTQEGVLYQEGYVDGTDWLVTQRLGDPSWNLNIATNKRGDIHLLWATYGDPSGSIHLWKPAGGEWQEPEYWEGISDFSPIFLSEDNILHLGFTASDGLDDEFFYVYWSEETGISESENISRRVGDIWDNNLQFQLDSKGTLHAVWGHPLSDPVYIDPFIGKAVVETGVFYAQRLGEGKWSTPEQISAFYSFAHNLVFELTKDDLPFVAWQNEAGLVYSIRADGLWTTPDLISYIAPPEDLVPFGPLFSIQPTTKLVSGKDANGTIYLAWMIIDQGLYLIRFDGSEWSEPLFFSEFNISSEKFDLPSFEFDQEEFKMEVTSDGVVHFAFFEDYIITYAKVIGDEIQVKEKFEKIQYDYFGSPGIQLIADDAGFVYLLCNPWLPKWTVFIPEEGMLPKPTPTPTLIPTPIAIPTQTQTPLSAETPVAQDSPQSGFDLGFFLVICLTLFFSGWIVNYLNKTVK